VLINVVDNYASQRQKEGISSKIELNRHIEENAFIN
jgi:hypothetical protein